MPTRKARSCGVPVGSVTLDIIYLAFSHLLVITQKLVGAGNPVASSDAIGRCACDYNAFLSLHNYSFANHSEDSPPIDNRMPPSDQADQL
jgi:hypothetical protein